MSKRDQVERFFAYIAKYPLIGGKQKRVDLVPRFFALRDQGAFKKEAIGTLLGQESLEFKSK